MLKNGQAVPVSAVPECSFEQFRGTLLDSVSRSGRVISLFAQPADGASVCLWAVIADDRHGSLQVARTRVEKSYPSLTPQCAQVHMFEREIWENTGVTPAGHPWLKSVRAHDGPETHPFFAMEGQEVHEVAVGPVHASVIEPGHFRFQCTGEVVQHLEIQLGYQHRGVEAALAGGPHRRSMIQMETVAGDTTIGHATAYCQALEALACVRVPERAQALRALALELERLANHVGDIGALSNDVGYLPPAAFCGRLRGDLLNMTTLVTGSRMGHSFVRPGGVMFDVDHAMVDQLRAAVEKAAADTSDAASLFFDSRSALSRMRGTGAVTTAMCRELGVVGVAARASGVHLDVRSDHPAGWYQSAGLEPPVETTGDVMARAVVRHREIVQSFNLVRKLLDSLPSGPVRAECPPLQPGMLAVSMVEGWRGEVAHVAITGPDGRLAAYKIVDPSFHNWIAVAMALRGQQISDFPLCNKSFNLSYCGFDL